MSASDWTFLRRLLERALEVDESARDAYLDEACAGDEEVRARVRALLDLDPVADEFEPPDSERLLRALERCRAEARTPSS